MLDQLIKKPFRLLYLPNENPNFVQSGPRAVFEDMLNDHTIDDHKVFSYHLEAQVSGDWSTRLLKLAEDFQPTVIFWQHIGNLPITVDFLAKLRNISSQPFLVYHEGDAYGRIRKRLTKSMKLLAKYSDLMFLIGLGELAEYFRKAGARNVMYAPHCADITRFGKNWDPHEPGRTGVIMIGNLIDRNPLFRNTPFLSFPGALERERFAQRLYERIGDRFRVYGQGWEKYPFSAGSIPFSDQEKVLHQSLLSVNWDHFPDIPFYFSDRLPNSLISGVAHATNYHPGYELLFQNNEYLVYYYTIREAIDIIDWMLCQPPKYLIEMGLAGERYVRQNLTTDIVYRRIVEIIKEKMSIPEPVITTQG